MFMSLHLLLQIGNALAYVYHPLLSSILEGFTKKKNYYLTFVLWDGFIIILPRTFTTIIIESNKSFSSTVLVRRHLFEQTTLFEQIFFSINEKQTVTICMECPYLLVLRSTWSI